MITILFIQDLGTEKNFDAVLEDIRKYKDDLNKYIEDEKPILFTGNSLEFLGKKIDDKEGLSIFDYEVKREKNRITSDVIYESKFFENKVVGFVNRSSKIYHNMNPLFKVYFGVGENENNDYEGVKYKNFYGTNVIGPLLVRNPEVLNVFVKLICEKNNIKYKEMEYKNENDGYNLVLSELEKRAKEMAK